MTLDQILGFNAEEFKALSEVQLTEICKPYFHITRPELYVRPESTKKKQINVLSGLIKTAEDRIKEEKIKMARALMAKHNIKI